MSDNWLQTPEQYTDLRLCGCGILHCVPMDAYGPAVSGAFCLICAAEGRGELRVSGESRRLEANSGIQIAPDHEFSLQADEFDPFTCVWIAFEGRSAAACLCALSIAEGTFPCDGAMLYQIAEEAQRLREPGLENEFLLQALLYRFFACLARGVPEQPEQAVVNRERQYVRRAAEFIRTHYCDGISVSDVAQYISLNRSYMTTLFQRVLEMSPQEYLSRYRLSRAEERLMNSDATVTAIAYSCGYQDPQVFSKAFRQRYGLTPVKYRAASKEQ